MRRSRKISAVALLAGSALVLSACGGGDGDEAGDGGAAQGGTVVYGACQPQNPLVPGDTNETCGGRVIDALFVAPMMYDPETAEPVPGVAESIETEDNQTFTVNLKEGWKFHNGEEVTADNFVKAWNYTAYGPNGLQQAYWFEQFEGFEDLQCPDEKCEQEPKAKEMSGLEVVDDYTFKITTTQPFSVLPNKLGYSAFAPLPDSFFEDPEGFGRNPIGNGAFKFVEWNDNQNIKVEKFADYPGTETHPKPSIDAINFKMYGDLDAEYQDLVAGNVDYSYQIPTSALAGGQWKADLGDRAVSQPQGATQTVTWAAYHEDYSGPGAVEFRKAVSRAIDRQAISEQIFHGARTPADGWVSPVVEGYKEGGQCGDLCVYDKEAANDLLAEAEEKGYTPPKEIPFYYNADGDHKAWTEAMANSVNQTLDGDFEIVAKPYPTFAEMRSDITEKKMDGLFRTGWLMDYPHIENFLNPLYKTNASANDAFYSNKELDAKLEAADAASSSEEAIQLYQEAEAMLTEDMTSIPVVHYTSNAGYSEKLTNVTVTPFGWLDIYNVQVTG